MNLALKLFALAIPVLLVSCNKNTDVKPSNNPGDTTITSTSANTIPAYVPPQPGVLQINVSYLILHPGHTATIAATLFNADGTVSSGSPSLIWQTSDAGVATVSSGLVTAVTVGSSQISTTDGIHGVLVCNVNVIPDSVAVPTGPVSATFAGNDAGIMILKPNGNQTIPTYTVYNASGQPVSSSASFVAPPGSGLTVSGGSIASGATTGSFDVTVMVGNDTLLTSLKVVCVTPKDTAYAVDVFPGSLPTAFYKNNITANPVLLRVTRCWFENDQPRSYHFVTSPDKLITKGNAVKLDAQGLLTSVESGGYWINELLLYYKKQSAHYWVGVYSNITGNWGGSASNGDKYNFCFTQNGRDISYMPELPLGIPYYFYDPNAYIPFSGSYYMAIDGIDYVGNFYSGKIIAAYSKGGFNSGQGIQIVNFSIPPTPGLSLQTTTLGQSSDDEMNIAVRINDNFGSVKLTRGAGDCGASPSCVISTTVFTYTEGGEQETLTYSYDDLNRLISVAAPGDGDISFTVTYNEKGLPVTVITASQITYTFTYDASDRLSSSDDSENTTTYTYNSNNQVIKSVDSDGSYKEFQYPGTDNNYSVITYYSAGGGMKRKETYQYDTKKRPYTSAALGFLLDGDGNPVSTTNNKTQIVSTSYTGGISYTVALTYTYNSEGYPATITEVYNDGTGASTDTTEFTYVNCQD